MATLHLPKNRPPRKKEPPEEKLDRQLDQGLKQTFPASDPVAATAPGGPVVDDASGRTQPGRSEQERPPSTGSARA
jgi:hypothetical protein